MRPILPYTFPFTQTEHQTLTEGKKDMPVNRKLSKKRNNGKESVDNRFFARNGQNSLLDGKRRSEERKSKIISFKKTDILTFQGPTALFAIQQGVFWTM